jgi:hypothetical protein
MLDSTASSQALLFGPRYDFPTQWAAFVNGTGDFAVMLEKQFFPYAAASAPLTVDALTLYADGAGAVASVTPATDLAALPAGLTGPAGAAPVTLPADDTVMVRVPAVQVFLVLQYHFGTA